MTIQTQINKMLAILNELPDKPLGWMLMLSNEREVLTRAELNAEHIIEVVRARVREKYTSSEIADATAMALVNTGVGIRLLPQPDPGNVGD